MGNVHSISCPEMKLTLRVGMFRLWKGSDGGGPDRMEILEEFLRVTKGHALVYHEECADSTPSMLDDVHLEEFEMGRDYKIVPVVPSDED